MKKWGMNLEGHVPTFGQKLDPGRYLVEVADQSYADDGTYGNKIAFTFRVLEGTSVGGTIRSILYISDEDFKPKNDGHAAAVVDNWYHLLVACGVKPKNFPDMRKVAAALMGKRLGIEVKDSAPTGPEKRVYANVQAYFPAAAISSSAEIPTPSEPDTEPEPELEDDGDDERETIDLDSIS